ncbi:MAG: response regulator transcription factor [Gammaproteobacteria bacterium]
MQFKVEIIDKGELTPREIEIVGCICNAMTDKQIARMLAISLKTVTNHIDHIHSKLGLTQEILNKRVALLRVAIARGLVRVVCLVLSVSVVSQANDASVLATRIQSNRLTSSSRRFD